MSDPRKPIFDAVRAARDGRAFVPDEVGALDNLLDALEVPRLERRGREIGPKGIALIKRFEGCKLEAYPDPGTGGAPWTIGWGATGLGIGPGVRWTQGQADRRLEQDLANYGSQVDRALGNAPTTQAQFDALVAFHYNTGKIDSATLTKKHKAGDYVGAANEFARWVYAGGKKLNGLVRRRAAEAELYRAGS